MNPSEKQVLGVIGGLGPIATAHFMELVTRMTDAQTDQQHLEMLVYSVPSIPDRTGYILDPSKASPLPAMIRIGKQLTAQGVGCIAIPCVTAHYFHTELSQQISVPIIHAIEETVGHLKAHGVQRVGIMATDGTIASGLFQRELESQGMEAIVPSPARQADVMGLIYDDIKANRPADMARFGAVSQQLRRSGTQAIILGCTELSLIKRDEDIGPGFIDALEILAQQSVLRCGGKLKQEYECLISQ